MKNTCKNQQSLDSCAASDAAATLGVSIPTVKRMVKDGTLEAFRTPGGHLRVTAESIEALKDQRQARPRRVPESSPVLQNRRERLEELNLETQEHRAKRNLTKLQHEEQEEAEKREAQAQARQEEAAQRQAEFELERERLDHEKAQERRRLERERAEEQARWEAEEELAAFRERWYDAAAEAVAAPRLAWLTAAQRKEVTEALEAEIDRRQPADAPRMGAIIARSLQAVVEPLQAERDVQERRQRVTQRALWSLSYCATDADRARAATAIREALQRFDATADETEMRVAAEQAVEPVRHVIERRMLDAKLVSWAIQELPWTRTDRDEARIRRECGEILAELPLDVAGPEGKEALEPTVREACAEINNRQAEKDREVRKARLIPQGIAEVSSYLMELRNQGEISDEEYWDSEFTADLRDLVKRGLEADLTGDETAKEVQELAREMIDEEFG